MNPLDLRSASWDLWEECREDYHLHEFAECLIPESGQDSFWAKSARSLFIETVRLLRPQPSYQKLQDIALKLPLKDVMNLYKSTKVASLMSPESEKTALSVRNTLMNELHALAYLSNQAPGFTIQSWIAEPDPNWLFLSCPTNQRALLRSFYSGWFSIVVRKMMNHYTRKVWFIIDELPSLNYLPELPRALAEIRKYGGCFVIGLQSLHQLHEVYGKASAQTIQSLTGTKVVFRCGDYISAKELSLLIGEQEIREPHESISFGSHQMRDGVNLSHQNQYKPAVSPTELMNLPNLTAYLILPGNFPITKMTFPYKQKPIITKGFLSK